MIKLKIPRMLSVVLPYPSFSENIAEFRVFMLYEEYFLPELKKMKIF
jgi:hypothetical protein